MQKSYHVNVRKLSHKRRNRLMIATVVVAAVIALVGTLLLHLYISPSTKISNSNPFITRTSGTSTGAQTTYRASDFSFQMSSGWSLVPDSSNSLYHIYEWQTGKAQEYETVQIFEDTIPTNFAVNHTVVIAASGAKLSVLGTPSDNCDTFTNGHSTNTQVGYPAKWQGVAFNCDLDNTQRDTVGTTSAAAINSVTLTSPAGGTHSFFFLYTDHALEPNYGDFEQLLNTFQLQ